MIKKNIKKIVEKAIGGEAINFSVEIPADKKYGDYSTNVAMVLKKNPTEIAEKIKSNIFEKVEVKNGFINFFISPDYLKKELKNILKLKTKKINKKINVEFISANPTGPLTLGNGRGGFGGDVLCNVLEKAGYKVTREYYVNDTGAQIKKLGHSIIGDEEAVYRGKYIDDLNKKVKSKDPEKAGEQAAKVILEKMIKPSIKKMGIKFDVWFSEKSLYKNKEVDKVITELTKKGFTYESEGAIWFKSKELGDDKDRVLVRADGIKTYFASDIAYLKNKFGRKFDKLIMFLGADHYGYVPRLRAAASAMGCNKEKIDALVLQLVRLYEGGKEVRMSKRSGIYVTIDELIDEVGLDAARFFFLTRAFDTHMNFDMDLAKKKSKENPVYYVQYAHARICSIIRKSGKFEIRNSKFETLNNPAELNLIREMIKFPEIIEDIVKDYQVQRLPQYAIKIADAFHKFYENCRVISEDKNVTEARLTLVFATKTILKNTLELMGVSAPQKM